MRPNAASFTLAVSLEKSNLGMGFLDRMLQFSGIKTLSTKTIHVASAHMGHATISPHPCVTVPASF
jgi:hypothetical protein